MHFSTDGTWRRQAIAEHWAMINALEERDLKILVSLCREHLKGRKHITCSFITVDK
jgi:DNA-binding GntR family transcriptional regulator